MSVYGDVGELKEHRFILRSTFIDYLLVLVSGSPTHRA